MAKKIKDENGNVYVQKKPFYKRFWFWLLVVIVILVGGGMAGHGGSSKNSSTSPSTQTSKVNQKNFDKIKISDSDGTSKEEVKKLFDKKPSSTSTQTIQGQTADMQVWKGSAIGSSVSVGFVNGHAISKGISGLDGSKKVTSKQFVSINNGMTQDQVKKALGNPAGKTYSSLMGQTSELWQYNGKGDLGANLTITFTNGAVSGKAQTGMNNN